MTKELRELLQVGTEGNNDLWKETIEAAQKLLKGGYYGHDADIENLEEREVKTGFDLEKVLSQGKWYWQMNDVEAVWTDYCPGCNIAYCQGRYTTGQCE